MSNMKEKCDLCNHKPVCKNVEEAYELQEKVNDIKHSDSFSIDINCLNFKDNYSIGNIGINQSSFAPFNPNYTSKFKEITCKDGGDENVKG